MVIKSKKLRWAGHVARMEDDIVDFKILTSTYSKEASRKAYA